MTTPLPRWCRMSRSLLFLLFVHDTTTVQTALTHFHVFFSLSILLFLQLSDHFIFSRFTIAVYAFPWRLPRRHSPAGLVSFCHVLWEVLDWVFFFFRFFLPGLGQAHGCKMYYLEFILQLSFYSLGVFLCVLSEAFGVCFFTSLAGMTGGAGQRTGFSFGHWTSSQKFKCNANLF